MTYSNNNSFPEIHGEIILVVSQYFFPVKITPNGKLHKLKNYAKPNNARPKYEKLMDGSLFPHKKV